MHTEKLLKYTAENSTENVCDVVNYVGQQWSSHYCLTQFTSSACHTYTKIKPNTTHITQPSRTRLPICGVCTNAAPQRNSFIYTYIRITRVVLAVYGYGLQRTCAQSACAVRMWLVVRSRITTIHNMHRTQNANTTQPHMHMQRILQACGQCKLGHAFTEPFARLSVKPVDR